MLEDIILENKHPEPILKIAAPTYFTNASLEETDRLYVGIILFTKEQDFDISTTIFLLSMHYSKSFYLLPSV